MTTSDYALIVSVASIVIAIGALAWNVWQKFIFVKPSLQVSFNLMNVLQPAADGHDFLGAQLVLHRVVQPLRGKTRGGQGVEGLPRQLDGYDGILATVAHQDGNGLIGQGAFRDQRRAQARADRICFCGDAHYPGIRCD